MTLRKLTPALAVVATGLFTGSGVALTTLPAHAAAPAHSGPHALEPGTAKPISASALAQMREKQRALAAQHRTAPTFARSGVKTFTVNALADSPLATPTGTQCVDALNGRCSLRAAVEAADNLDVPVRIVLGAHTYTLTTATALRVTNPRGVSIVGQGTGKTAIAGSGSGLLYVTATATGDPSGHLFLTSLRLKNGTASSGGAVFLDDTSGADLVLDHVAASNNTATYGGAICADDYNGVYISNSTFSGNHADYGGALELYWGDAQIKNTTFTNNGSVAGDYGDGGAIYNEYGVLTITGGSISGNHAGDDTHFGQGGGIYDEYGNVTLTNVHLDGNTAPGGGSGGGFYSYYDLLEVNHGTISHNRASGTDGSGGGIYQYYGSQIDLHGVTMAGNRAGGALDSGYGGGALMLYGYQGYGNQTTIDQGTKITGSNGSAIYGYAYEGQIDLDISGATINGNHNTTNNGMDSYGCGGAICLYDYYSGTMNLSVTGSHFVKNSSTGNNGSGAVTVYGYDYGGASVSLAHNVFEDNTAGTGGYGGAVLVYNDQSYNVMSLRSQSNTFVGNRAGSATGEGWGGALAVYYYATLTDRGSTFSKNVAIGDGAYGGAVSNESYQSARFVGSKFVGNRAGPTNGGGYGGAVYTDDEAGTAFSKVTMAGNKAGQYGGGIYGGDYEYQTTVTRSTFSGNTAGNSDTAGYGGAIYAQDDVLSVQNSTFNGNRAQSVTGTPGQGGAIWFSGSRMGLTYSTVAGNYARRGAGVYAYAEGGSLLGDILSQNRTSRHGSEQDCAVGSAYSKLSSVGGNVLGQASCVTGLQPTDKVSKKPRLGKLKDNGGPTKTMAISAKSPAVGRASYLVPATDQRGHGRPGKHADAGAFELPKQH